MKQSSLNSIMNTPKNDSCDIYLAIKKTNLFRLKSFSQHLIVFMLFSLLFSCKQTDDEFPTPTVVQYFEKMKLFSIPDEMAQSTNVWAQDATRASDSKEDLRDNFLHNIADYYVYMIDSSVSAKNYFKTNYPEDLSWMICSVENTINRWEFCYTGIVPLKIIEEEINGSNGTLKTNFNQREYLNIISWTFLEDNKLIINEEYLEPGFRYQTIYSADHSGSFESFYDGKPITKVQWNADGSGLRHIYTDSIITETEEWTVVDL